MKPIKYFYTFLIVTLTIGTMRAQQGNNSEISSESTEKTYRVITDNSVVKNSVKVNTTISQDIVIEEDDESKIDATRIMPPKRITKTVLIDNDDDDEFDEKIVFSYMSDSNSDFTLVTNNDEVVVAIDSGDDLKILTTEGSINKNNLDKKAHVFTSEDGKKVEFYIESYEILH